MAAPQAATVNIRLCRTLTHMTGMQEQVGYKVRAATGNNFSPTPQCQEGRFWAQLLLRADGQRQKMTGAIRSGCGHPRDVRDIAKRRAPRRAPIFALIAGLIVRQAAFLRTAYERYLRHLIWLEPILNVVEDIDAGATQRPGAMLHRGFFLSNSQKRAKSKEDTCCFIRPNVSNG